MMNINCDIVKRLWDIFAPSILINLYTPCEVSQIMTFTAQTDSLTFEQCHLFLQNWALGTLVNN